MRENKSELHVHYQHIRQLLYLRKELASKPLITLIYTTLVDTHLHSTCKVLVTILLYARSPSIIPVYL